MNMPKPCSNHTKLEVSCDECWNNAFDFLKQNKEYDRKQKQEAIKNMKESTMFSQTFNRRGCPYCGGIS
jgi:hypothetical protein